MDREKFIRPSISTRVYEKNLLTTNNIQRLVDSESLSEALGSLNDTSYGVYLKNLDRDEDYEEALYEALKDSYEKISSISPDSQLVVFLEEKYNFHNLKVMVKELIQNEDYQKAYMDIGKIDIVNIRKELKSEKDQFDNFYLEAAKKALDLYEESKDPQDIDLSLDRDFYEKLLKDAKNLEYDSLIGFIKNRIDLINLKSLLRIKGQDQTVDLLKKALIDGGFVEKNRLIEAFNLDISSLSNIFIKEDSYPYLKDALEEDDIYKAMQEIELGIDNHLVDFAKNSKKVSYGPEVLLGYLISREMEIKNLRIIFVAKVNGLSREFLEERLRNLYV